MWGIEIICGIVSRHIFHSQASVGRWVTLFAWGLMSWEAGSVEHTLLFRIFCQAVCHMSSDTPRVGDHTRCSFWGYYLAVITVQSYCRKAVCSNKARKQRDNVKPVGHASALSWHLWGWERAGVVQYFCDKPSVRAGKGKAWLAPATPVSSCFASKLQRRVERNMMWVPVVPVFLGKERKKKEIWVGRMKRELTGIWELLSTFLIGVLQKSRHLTCLFISIQLLLHWNSSVSC